MSIADRARLAWMEWVGATHEPGRRVRCAVGSLEIERLWLDDAGWVRDGAGTVIVELRDDGAYWRERHLDRLRRLHSALPWRRGTLWLMNREGTRHGATTPR